MRHSKWGWVFGAVLACLVVLFIVHSLTERANGLMALHVEGRYLVDDQGRRVRLEGVSIPDPEHVDLKRVGYNASSLIDRAVRRYRSQVIRLPVLPGDDGKTGFFVDPERYYREHLLPAIERCRALGVYVIVDLHYVSDYEPVKEKVLFFWRFMTPRLKNYPNVLFEIFNEPVAPASWERWLHSVAQPTVDLIRSLGAKNVLIVGGPQWSMLMAGAARLPVQDSNIAYTAHIYPGHPRDSWDKNYGPLMAKFPVFVTEWGYEQGAPHPVGGTTSDFGVPLKQWLDEHELSWVAWVFDNEWDGKMFDPSWHLKGGEQGSGEFVTNLLKKTH